MSNKKEEALKEKARAWLRTAGEVNERTLSQKFAQEIGSDYWRYDVDNKYWLQWVGTHWAPKHTPEMMETLGQYAGAQALLFFAIGRLTLARVSSFHSQRTVAAMEKICRSLPTLMVRSDIFDQDDFQLGTPGGTVCLKTGKLAGARPEDYITILTTVTPAPPGTPCPRYLAFLDEVTRGDKDLQRTLQQFAGGAASGSTRDQRLLFLWGSGRNGKGVFTGVLSRILGEHVAPTVRDFLVERRYTGHQTFLVEIAKARLAIAPEIPEGSAWDTTLIKQLTGGGKLSGNRMHNDPLKLKVRCSLIIEGNIKPEIKTVDEAVRDRFLLATFPVYIPPERRIADFDAVLVAAEGPAILRWIIDGAVDREISGKLHVAAAIEAGTREYMDDEDIMTDFLAECFDRDTTMTMEFDPDWRVKTADAYELWRGFCGRFGRKSGARNPFTTAMCGAGVPRKKIDDVWHFVCIRSKLGII